ncbi:MAG: acetolactate synthase small subunit [Candidatus Moranbacteria bacterium]|nr:acetolactate synthase small subunit [Candidatus Moranbacteria bacterium]
MTTKRNQQIVLIKVEDKPGVLSKISSLCRRRRYNIKSLTVGTTDKKGLSQITLVFSKEEERIQNIANQIDKLIEVIEVEVVNPRNVIDKEVILLIAKNGRLEEYIFKKSTSYDINVRTINEIQGNPVYEILGEGGAIELFLDGIDLKNDVVKMVRSGLIALKI